MMTHGGMLSPAVAPPLMLPPAVEDQFPMAVCFRWCHPGFPNEAFHHVVLLELISLFERHAMSVFESSSCVSEVVALLVF